MQNNSQNMLDEGQMYMTKTSSAFKQGRWRSVPSCFAESKPSINQLSFKSGNVLPIRYKINGDHEEILVWYF